MATPHGERSRRREAELLGPPPLRPAGTTNQGVSMLTVDPVELPVADEVGQAIQPAPVWRPDDMFCDLAVSHPELAPVWRAMDTIRRYICWHWVTEGIGATEGPDLPASSPSYGELEAAVNELTLVHRDRISSDARDALRHYRNQEHVVRRGSRTRTEPEWEEASLGVLDALSDWIATLTGGTAQRTRRASSENEPAPPTAVENCFVHLSTVWEVEFLGDGKAAKGMPERGTFYDSERSGNRHLARLLDEPHKELAHRDFFPPPPGKGPIPFMGRDDVSDSWTVTLFIHRVAAGAAGTCQ